MGSICGNSNQVSDTNKLNKANDPSRDHKKSVPRIEFILGNTVSFPFSLINLNNNKSSITSPYHQIRNFFSKEDSLFMNKKLQEILDDFKIIYGFDDDMNVLRYDGLVTVVLGKIGDVMHVAKHRAFNDFSIFSDFLLYIQSLCKYRIKSIKPPNKIKLHQEDLTDEDGKKLTTYSVSLLREYYSLNYQDLLKNDTIKANDYELILRVLGNIAKTMKKLHRKGLAFKSLTPSCIMIKDLAHVEKSYLLVGNSFSLDSHKEFLKHYVEKPEDYQALDVLSLCFVLIVSLNKQIDYSILYRIRSQEDIDEIIEACKGLPKLLTEFLRRNMKYDRKKLPSMNEIRSQLVSLYHKGPQTMFKNDSVAAYLNTHHKPHHSIYSNLIYFHWKNKIHVYNIETKQFNILNVLFNKKKWLIRSSKLFYSKNEKAFLTFARKTSPRLVKIEFDLDSQEAKIKINLEVVVQYFFEIKKKVSDPDLFVYEDEANARESDIFLFDSEKIIAENGSEKYYPSYRISVKYEAEREAGTGLIKKTFEVSEGPLINTWKRGGFFFFDMHNNQMYSIPEGINIFAKGIRYFTANLKEKDPVFKEATLMMAISSEELFQNFCKLNLKLENFEFCCEIQHGVYLLLASRVMFILDFNLACFYSFCSLNQIQKFRENNVKLPNNFTFAFEIRNMPFNLNFSKPGNNNVTFQDGHLLWLCKKDKKPLICKLLILTDQAALVLIKLIDPETGNNLLEHLPKVIDDAWMLTTKKQLSLNQKIMGKLGNYEVLEPLGEKDSFKVRLADDVFAMKKVKLGKIEEFEVFELGSFIALNSTYLLDIIENFIYKDEQGDLYSVIIREFYNRTLEDEFLSRKRTGAYYSKKEIAFLIRVLMKGVSYLKSHNFKCGRISLNSVVVTPKGFFKIESWYFEEAENQNYDILCSASVILSCCCLEQVASPITASSIEAGSSKLNRYPGVEEFLRSLLNFKNESVLSQGRLSSLPTDSGLYKHDIHILDDLWHELSINLQYSDIKIEEISSEMKEIFWISYDKNFFLISDITNQTFKKIEVYQPEGDDEPYDFSSFNMFTYDLNNRLYVVGSNRRAEFQDFFSIGIDSSQKLTRLPSIPYRVIMPSAVYVKKTHSVYLFGGYSIINERKEPSKRAFRYNITSETWQELAPMPLALVSATAVFDKVGNIFLFGGESDEIDLTCPELIYMTYSLENNTYESQVNYSLKSPFKNSRFLKPIIIPLTSTIFLWYQKLDNNYQMSIFELKTGGIHLKYQYNLPSADKFDMNDQTEIFYKPVEETVRFRQDELSVSFQGGILYNLDENTKDLLVWNIQKPGKSSFRVIPSQIITDDDVNKSFEIFERENLD